MGKALAIGRIVLFQQDEDKQLPAIIVAEPKDKLQQYVNLQVFRDDGHDGTFYVKDVRYSSMGEVGTARFYDDVGQAPAQPPQNPPASSKATTQAPPPALPATTPPATEEAKEGTQTITVDD
jgi:hypothetical protein